MDEKFLDDARYFRPTEVESLSGDATKAKQPGRAAGINLGEVLESLLTITSSTCTQTTRLPRERIESSFQEQ